MDSAEAVTSLLLGPRAGIGPLAAEVHADAEAVARRAAVLMADVARGAIAARGQFLLALSGGATPWPALRLFADADVDWSLVHVAQVDERVVAEGGPDRNLARLRTALLSRVALPAAHVHAMPVDDADLAAAAARYEEELVLLAGAPPLLDLVQLGLGTDGHTASLVPGDAALLVAQRDVAITGAYNGHRRMTLTFPIINRSRRILWIVTGGEKADALRRLAAGDATAPASHVRRLDAIVLTDRAAAAGLTVPAP